MSQPRFTIADRTAKAQINADLMYPSKPMVLARWDWYKSDLEAWYIWANTHDDGICTTFVTFEDNIVTSLTKDGIIYSDIVK